MHFFIINPTSGRGQGYKTWLKVQEILSRKQIPYEYQLTEESSHATAIARSALQNQYKAIITIGGDGTIHEVGNALVGTTTPMGVISGGTGNDMITALGIPVNPEEALEQIMKHQIQWIDTADIGDRIMIGSLGMGFDATVADKVNHSGWKKWMGRFSYFYGIIQVLSSYIPSTVTLEVDAQIYKLDEVWFIAITNIPNYGGGMHICPEASYNDGLLDICCVRNVSKSQLVRMALTLYQGSHVNSPGVSMYRGSGITIQSEIPLPVHADGEVIAKTPLSIRVQPKSLCVLR